MWQSLPIASNDFLDLLLGMCVITFLKSHTCHFSLYLQFNHCKCKKGKKKKKENHRIIFSNCFIWVVLDAEPALITLGDQVKEFTLDGTPVHWRTSFAHVHKLIRPLWQFRATNALSRVLKRPCRKNKEDKCLEGISSDCWCLWWVYVACSHLALLIPSSMHLFHQNRRKKKTLDGQYTPTIDSIYEQLVAWQLKCLGTCPKCLEGEGSSVCFKLNVL